ncbi:hypothetical protein CRT60_28120 [Azospirillum palustre]|uniref:HAMP domain-containing protein n=1 Tax=Azospirillum palustre TaxID=2044885 RepID=A0A2B8BBA6_9PROT|nr:hypothetical protein CRT60_28120 [Azospirillum palustre]
MAGVGAALLILNAVVKPLHALTGTMGRLANREMSTEIPGTARQDELGAMARAVQVFKDNMIEADRLAAVEAAEQQAKLRRAQAVERLLTGFENSSTAALRTVAAAASELDATAHSMSAMAQQTSTQATVVASAAEQTSANVQTVATATEEMASSIREIGTQIARSARSGRSGCRSRGSNWPFPRWRWRRSGRWRWSVRRPTPRRSPGCWSAAPLPTCCARWRPTPMRPLPRCAGRPSTNSRSR